MTSFYLLNVPFEFQIFFPCFLVFVCHQFLL